MSDYFTIKTENALKKAQEEMTCLLKKLLDTDSEFSKATIDKVSVMTGISTERLHEITNLAPAKPEELHAIGNAIIVLDGLTDEDSYCDLADESEEIIGHWMMDTIFCRDPYRSLDLLKYLSRVELLDSFFSSYHIFLTEDALCHPMMGSFLDLAIPLIEKSANPLKMIVSKISVDNLIQKEKDFDQNKLFGATVGLSNINRLQDQELLSVRSDESDATIMSVFISALAKYKPTNKLLLITQDDKLARATRLLNESGIEGKEILIVKLCEEHLLREWYPLESDDEICFSCELPEEEEFDQILDVDDTLEDTDDEINLTEESFDGEFDPDEALSDEERSDGDPEFRTCFWNVNFESDAKDTDEEATVDENNENA